MKLRGKKVYHIPADWRRIAVLCICAAGSGYFTVTGYKPRGGGSRVDPWFLLLVTLVMLVFFGRSYTLFEGSLVINLFSIPIRRIPWNQIQQIAFFREWKDGSRVEKESIFLVTVKPCLPYYRKSKGVKSHVREHPFQSFIIRLPSGKENECISAMEKCYGEVEFWEESNS